MTTYYQVILYVDGQNGIDLGDQLDTLTIMSGSSDGWEQPSAASCQISFLGLPIQNGATLSPSWWLGRNIGIAVSASGTIPKGMFYGRVINVTATPQDSSAETVMISLSLQSKMGDLQNYLITNDRAIETETARAAGLVSDGLATSWAEAASNLTWDIVGPTTTWATYNASSNINFSQAGTSTKSMVAYVNNNASIDNVMFDFAVGENGFFGERIAYSLTAPNFTYFLHYTQSSQWSNVPSVTVDLATCAISDELSTNISIADIYNYFSADNGVITRSFENPTSVASYGLRPFNLSTQFSSGNDIDTMLAQRSAGRSVPQQSLTSVTIDYDLLDFTKHLYFIGLINPISFTNIPALYGGDQIYFVRGCELTMSYLHAEAKWMLTPQEQLAYYQSWALVDPAAIWTSYATATTKWQDLT